MIGSSPNIPLNASVSDQIAMQFDFRQIYSSIMQDWLCMSEAQTTDVLGGSFTKLAIFKNTTLDTISFQNDNFFVIYPNPITENTININFKDILNGYVNVQIFTIQGTKVFNKSFRINDTKLKFSLDNLMASGIYILELEYNNYKFHTKMIIS
jgi:hypothetical protein